MVTYILQHDGIYLCTNVQEGHATFSIYLHSGHIFDSVPSLERAWIQEGSLWGFYALGASVWGLLAALIVVRGV